MESVFIKVDVKDELPPIGVTVPGINDKGDFEQVVTDDGVNWYIYGRDNNIPISNGLITHWLREVGLPQNADIGYAARCYTNNRYGGAQKEYNLKTISLLTVSNIFSHGVRWALGMLKG